MRRKAVAAIGAVCLAGFVVCPAHAEPSSAQAARLAQLRPESVLISRGSEMLAIRGGDLGRFDPQLSAVENLQKLIAHLGLLHQPARSAEFVVTEQMPQFVRFTQVIGGIPVSARIEVDLDPDGRVAEAHLAVVDPALAPQAQPITRERALQIAALACAEQAGAADAEVELEDFPGLRYKPAAQGQPLKLEYRFSASARNLPSGFVTVDALSGAVAISSAAIP
jgi:hypothetical protein